MPMAAIDTSLDEWLRTADEAMYAVKRAGGNGLRVVAAEPSDGTVPVVA
jgi:hypothetical protein